MIPDILTSLVSLLFIYLFIFWWHWGLNPGLSFYNLHLSLVVFIPHTSQKSFTMVSNGFLLCLFFTITIAIEQSLLVT
jgi:hypothetical protein